MSLKHIDKEGESSRALSTIAKCVEDFMVIKGTQKVKIFLRRYFVMPFPPCSTWDWKVFMLILYVSFVNNLKNQSSMRYGLVELQMGSNVQMTWKVKLQKYSQSLVLNTPIFSKISQFSPKFRQLWHMWHLFDFIYWIYWMSCALHLH